MISIYEHTRTTEQHIDEMVSTFQNSGLNVVMGTVPPVRGKMSARFPEQTNDRIVELNDWIRSYASQKHILLVDYYKAMSASDGSLDESLTYDGVHPNDAGCYVMTQAAAAVIEPALNR